MRLTRLHQVGANTRDLGETRSFYEDKLGARFIAMYEAAGLLFFEFCGTRLLFEKDNSPATLYFWVDDIERSYSELLAKGIRFEDEPHLIHRDEEGIFDNPGTEEWMTFFKDPGGNTISLATRRVHG